MTDVVREIDGVTVIAMLDQSTDSGEVAEVGFDYFALDKDGNVWLMGGYTEDFQAGEFTSAGEAWLGAATGGVPGVLMPGEVRADTQRWAIAAVDAAEQPSLGEPVEVGISKCVAFGCFDNVTVIREGEFKAIDNELKYYAPGVGVIFNDPQQESLHQDSFELVNIVELTPAGLAEMSWISKSTPARPSLRCTARLSGRCGCHERCRPGPPPGRGVEVLPIPQRTHHRAHRRRSDHPAGREGEPDGALGQR